MGIFIKDIANITKTPAKVSLSNNPNFIAFESKNNLSKKVEIELDIIGSGYSSSNRTFYRSDGYDEMNGYYILQNGIPVYVSLSGSPIYDPTFTFTIVINNTNPAICNYTGLIDKDLIFIFKLANGLEEYFPVNGSVSSIDTLNFTIPANTVSITLTCFFFMNEFRLEVEEIGPNRFDNISGFTIRETKTNTDHIFKGTSDIYSVSGNTFYLGRYDHPLPPEWLDHPEKTAQSLRESLLNNRFIGENFDVNLNLITKDDGTVSFGTKIKLSSKGAGDSYAFRIIPEDNRLLTDFFNYTGNPEDTYNRDSIAEGYDPVDIQLEMYTDTGVFLGVEDKLTDNFGELFSRLQKTYMYNPIWFDLNILKSNEYSIEVLNSTDWVNTGTLKDYRFIGKRVINDPQYHDNAIFYISDVFYLVTGYKRNLEINDLSEYMYNTQTDNKVIPLSNRSTFTHIKGQKQFYNFILSDPDRNNDLGTQEYTIGLLYRLKTQSGEMIQDVYLHEQNRKKFNIINSIRLDIDKAMIDIANVSRVEVFLCRNRDIISTPVEFTILPECIYKLSDFAFLNSLGGWSSFNFGGTSETDFKADANTLFKTHTPESTISSQIESVYAKDTEEQFSVETMPINKEVCDWLKELSSSIAVYELSTGRYIIVEELNIKPNSIDDLSRLQMKYRYSDSYNARIV